MREILSTETSKLIINGEFIKKLNFLKIGLILATKAKSFGLENEEFHVIKIVKPKFWPNFGHTGATYIVGHQNFDKSPQFNQ